MGSLPFTQTPADPALKDLLDALSKSISLNLSCHHVGTIQSFNAENQTATATINYKKTYYQLNSSTGLYDSLLVDYPALADCPVVCLGGGPGALTFPIQQGDECLVLFNDRDIDNWFRGGNGAPTATPRLHSFADGIILVGIRSLGNVLEDYDTARTVLRNAQTMVGLSETLVKIANDTASLLEVFEGLITAINGLQITAPPGGGLCAVAPISPSPSPGDLLE